MYMWICSQAYMPSCVYMSMCVRMSAYEYIISLTSMCTSGCLCVSTPSCEYVWKCLCGHVWVCVCIYIWELTSVCHVSSLSHWVWCRVCPSVDMWKYACVYTCVCEWMYVLHGCYVMEIYAMHVCLCLRVNGNVHMGPRAMRVCLCVGISVGICACACLMVCVCERELGRGLPR